MIKPLNPFVNAEQIDRVYMAQSNYQSFAKASTAKSRIQLLSQLEKAILKYRKDIERALFLDLGKHAIESDYAEIFSSLSELRHIQAHLKKWMHPLPVRNNLLFFGTNSYILSEPKGKTLIISPWNYPFQLPIVHLAASVAAGNTVILKPSEFAVHTNIILKKIIESVFSTEHVSVLEGAVEETTKLLSLKFDHIHFTGSSAVGKIVMQAAAKQLCAVTLELGGKSPLFMDKQVPLRKTIKNIIWAKFMNAGQTCIAPDYLLVDEQLKLEFIQIFQEEIKLAFGAHASQSSDYPRIINEKQLDRLIQLLEEAQDLGAEILYGGQVLKEQLYMEPTLIEPQVYTGQLMQQEIFGPILPVIFYERLKHALDLVQQQEKPLACYIFSEDKKYINQVIDQTSAGSTCVNDAVIQILHPNLPFSGVNHSGIGQSMGIFGFQDFSHQRAIVQSSPWLRMSSFFWYPYTKGTQKIVDWLMKWF